MRRDTGYRGSRWHGGPNRGLRPRSWSRAGRRIADRRGPPGQLAHQRREQMLELVRRIVREPGVDRRWLDDRAGRRHEPVEALGWPEHRDRTGGVVACGDPL